MRRHGDDLTGHFASDDQFALALGDRDLCLCPGIEFQAIRLDTVAENDTVLRHQRSKAQPFAPRQASANQLGLRCLAWKRFAHRELQFLGVPCPRRIARGLRLLAECFGDRQRAGDDALEPCGRAEASRDDQPAR